MVFVGSLNLILHFYVGLCSQELKQYSTDGDWNTGHLFGREKDYLTLWRVVLVKKLTVA
jgi:hypothetical protein